LGAMWAAGRRRLGLPPGGLLNFFPFERGKGRDGAFFCEPTTIGEGDRGIDGVDGDFGGRDSRSERFSDLDDIDITPAPIDWAGDLKNQNNKKINGTEFKCCSLDFTGASGESWLPMRMKISRDIDIAVHELHCSAQN
jgi:hypothetical protein